ncbi:hypothetical protein MRX96_051171 [Rhipicephalus microplus]
MRNVVSAALCALQQTTIRGRASSNGRQKFRGAAIATDGVVCRHPGPPQALQHVKVPAIKRLAAEPERVAKEAVPAEAATAAEVQRDSSGSDNDMHVCHQCPTKAYAEKESGERDKTSATNNEEPPAKTP